MTQREFLAADALEGTLEMLDKARQNLNGDILSAKAASEQAVLDAATATLKLSGISNQASLGAVPDGPAGIPENDARALKIQGVTRFEKIPFGIGANATVLTAGNIPGQRTAVNGINSMAELAGYGLDMVGLFLGFDVDPAVFAVPTGVATFTANTFAAASGSIPWNLIFDEDGHLRKGMIVRTTHPDKWYGAILAADQSSGTVTVTPWRKGSVQSGPTGTPPNSTGAIVQVNVIDKAFLLNGVLGILPNSPTRTGTWAEPDVYLAGGDAAVDFFISTLLGPDGSSTTGVVYGARRSPTAGRAKYIFASFGAAYLATLYSGPDPLYDPAQPRPQWDAILEHGTAGGILSKGDRPHFVAQSGNGTEVFRVEADGTLKVGGVALGVVGSYAKGWNLSQFNPALNTWTRVPLKGDAGTRNTVPFSSANGTYVVPKDGVYTLSASCTLTNGAVGHYVILAVAVNGIRVLNFGEFYMAGVVQGSNGGGELPLLAGDVVELQVYLGNGGTVYGDGTNQATTQMSVTRLF